MYWWYIAILLVVCGQTEGDTNVETSISFKKAELYLKTSYATYHMELDRYKNDGSFLLGTDNGLLTTDGQTTLTLVSFYVTGFTQLNTTHVVLVDHGSNCIKVLTREDNNIKVIAGSCGTRGYKEGRVGVGQLFYPWGVQIDVRNSKDLLVTDGNNNAIRSVDMKTGELSTVINTGFHFPRGFLWAGRQLLVANYHQYISQVSWSSNGTVSNTILAGLTRSGDVIGSFDIAKFYLPYDFEEVTDNLFLVIDYGNRKLKLINMEKRIVGPVCFKGEDPCTESSLLPRRPQTLLNVGGVIYVGMNQDIYKLSDSETMRRLSFKAEYDVTCDLLNGNISRAELRLTLTHRRNQLQSICAGNCKMSTTTAPFYNCTNDLLTLYWPTDKLYPATTLEPPAVLNDKLRKRLNQSEVLRTPEIFIFSKQPPIVNAKKNSKGEVVEVILYSTCADETETYDAVKDTCT